MRGQYNLLDFASPTTVSKNITDFLTSYGRKKNYESGHVLANEGENSRSVYIVLEGDVEILKLDDAGNQNIIARVGQGTIIGEMGVFLDQKRTGTIRAATAVTILEFANENFLTALNRIPELSFRLFKSLSTKIVKANSTLVHQASNQSVFTIGVALLELKPAKVTNNLGQLTLHPTAISEDTGVERKTVRSVIEQFKEKRIVTAASITYDGSIMLTVDFSRLSRYLKSLANKQGMISEPLVVDKKDVLPPKQTPQYELPKRKGLPY